MGYTHYIHNKGINIIAPLQRKRITRDVLHLFKHLPNGIKLVSMYDSKKPPEANLMGIQFNGVQDFGEDFLFDYIQSDAIQYCKTNRLPYNLVVCVTLMLISTHVSGKVKLSFTSDGINEDDLDSEWMDAIRHFKQLFPNYDQKKVCKHFPKVFAEQFSLA